MCICVRVSVGVHVYVQRIYGLYRCMFKVQHVSLCMCVNVQVQTRDIRRELCFNVEAL